MRVDFQLYTSHPNETETEKEMDSYLFLEKLGVPYIRVRHDEAPTIDALYRVESIIEAPICKNLLLCNRQQTDFYLLLLPGDMIFKTKDLSAQINSSRLSFATGAQMQALLNVTPGSLTVLSLLFDKEKRVRLLIEKSVFDHKYFACHPCVNTATVRMLTTDLLEKVLPVLDREYTVVDLSYNGNDNTLN